MDIYPFIRNFIRRIDMNNKAKLLQGLVIVVILMGTVGAVAALAPVTGHALACPVLAVSPNHPNLTSAPEPVQYASVAWNHWNRDKHKSVAWNGTHRG
jgi:hypothetical protein